MEHGWALGHDALVGASIERVHGTPRGPADHGVATLGLLCGRAPGLGPPLAPGARVGLIGWWREGSGAAVYDPEGACAAVTGVVGPGDVVLVMAQERGARAAGPAWSVLPAAAAWERAGAWVVFPAGNGAEDADPAPVQPRPGLVVGALRAGGEPAPMWASTRGAEVDAWVVGEGWWTPDAGAHGERTWQVGRGRAGTSTAAAVAAGALATLRGALPRDVDGATLREAVCRGSRAVDGERGRMLRLPELAVALCGAVGEPAPAWAVRGARGVWRS